MKNRNLYTLLLIILFTASCVYNEDGIYFSDIVPGDPPTIIVSTNLDTLENPSVTDSLEIIYEITVDYGEVLWTQFLLSDSLVFESDNPSSSFWLKSNILRDSALFTLNMESFYSTNTGSLADVIGIEALKETKIYHIWFYGND